jgi:hypothetical protein
LLLNPSLDRKIQDIVVEFGNARFQDVADRFVVEGLPVSSTELKSIWRFTIGGGVLWDAPVYEQFFRTVRAINWMRPRERRLRVLLGDPPFDHTKVQSERDREYVLSAQRQRDSHYADLVEREVLKKGRRALLIAGSGHLLKGVHPNNDPHGRDAGTLLAERHPGSLFVVDPLIVPPGADDHALLRRVRAAVAEWPRPSLAHLEGTWLGDTIESARPWINSQAYRAIDTSFLRYGAQADAVLYLGPSEVLTASRPAPEVYGEGPYRDELTRLSQVMGALGRPTDFLAEGLRRARGGASWFDQ